MTVASSPPGMRGAPITARDRRAILVGALIVLPAVAWTLAVRPYRAELERVRASVDQERSLLERERALLARVDRMPATARLAAQTPGDSLLFDAPDADAATAALASHVAAIAADAAVVLRQTEASGARQGERGLAELTVRIQGEGDVEGIMQLLSVLRTDARLMRVSALSIDAGAAGAPAGSEALAFSATVHGYSTVATQAP